MNLNWTTLEQRKSQRYDGFNSIYISCIVYSCNPAVKVGGVIQYCRWDVKNECWMESDVMANWYLQEPFKITHFADDIVGPYGA